jgi:rare lipoprotein A
LKGCRRIRWGKRFLVGQDRLDAGGDGVPARLKHARVAQAQVFYYGRKFSGRRTASGERFNPGAMTMAYRTLPFGTKLRVTNVTNDRSVVMRVNDRGSSRRALIGDLSTAAAGSIGMLHAGIAKVRMQVVAPAKPGKVANARQAPHARPASRPVGTVPLEA